MLEQYLGFARRGANFQIKVDSQLTTHKSVVCKWFAKDIDPSLGLERKGTWSSAHHNTHLKSNVGALLSRALNNYNTPLFWAKNYLKNSSQLLIRRSNYLLFFWSFSVTLYKQLTRSVHYFVSKLITNCYPVNNPRCLCYKLLCCGFWEIPQRPFYKIN